MEIRAGADGRSARTRIRQKSAARSSILVWRRSFMTHGSAVVGAMIAHCFFTILRSFFLAGRCSGASNPLRLAFFHDAGRCNSCLTFAFVVFRCSPKQSCMKDLYNLVMYVASCWIINLGRHCQVRIRYSVGGAAFAHAGRPRCELPIAGPSNRKSITGCQ